MAEPLAPRVPEITVRFTLNGAPVSARAWPMERLLDLLRRRLRVTGPKEGCGEGECGACAVLLDGALVNACLVPALQVEGAEVVTVEGLREHPAFGPLSRAFVRLNGAQCGICTPGMVVAAVALLERERDPDEAAVREALAGNLCRCTGYGKIVAAVRAAAAELRGEGAAP